MPKKSQSQIFTYAFGLIVAALILAFGYRALFGVGEQTELSRLSEFKASLDADIASVGLQFGTVKHVTYTVPGFVSEVCFYAPSDAQTQTDESCRSISDYPLIKNSIEDNSGKNFFILGELPETLSVQYLDTGICQLRCFSASNGRISMVLEGKGNKTYILS